MEAYETEEQQVEAIKSWWKENGKAVVIGGVVGIGAILGWKYYQSSQITAKETASAAYERALTALQASELQMRLNLHKHLLMQIKAVNMHH